MMKKALALALSLSLCLGVLLPTTLAEDVEQPVTPENVEQPALFENIGQPALPKDQEQPAPSEEEEPSVPEEMEQSATSEEEAQPAVFAQSSGLPDGLGHETVGQTEVYTLTGHVTLGQTEQDLLNIPGKAIWKLGEYTLTLTKGVQFVLQTNESVLSLSGGGSIVAEGGGTAVRIESDDGHIVAHDGNGTDYTGGTVTVRYRNQCMGGMRPVTGCKTAEIAKRFDIQNLSSDVQEITYPSFEGKYSVYAVPVTGRPSVQLGESGWCRVYANGCPLKVVEGTGKDERGNPYTNILWDADSNGTIEDTERLKIGDQDPSGAGYDLYKDITYLFGGSEKRAVTGNTNIEIAGGRLSGVYGGGNEAGGTVSGDARVTISGGNVDTVTGGNSGVKGAVYITVNGTGEVTRLCGGEKQEAPFAGTVHITVAEGAKVYRLYSGGYGSAVGEAHITVTGGEVGELYTGGEKSIIGEMPSVPKAEVTITGGQVEEVYAAHTTNSSITVGSEAKVGWSIEDEGSQLYLGGISIGGENGVSAITLDPALTERAMVVLQMDKELASPYALAPSAASPAQSMQYLSMQSDVGIWTAQVGEDGMSLQALFAPPPLPTVNEEGKTVAADGNWTLCVQDGSADGKSKLSCVISGSQTGSATDLGEYDLRDWTITAEGTVRVNGGAVGTVQAASAEVSGGRVNTLTVKGSATVTGGSIDTLTAAQSSIAGSAQIEACMVGKTLDSGDIRIENFTGHITLCLPDDFEIPSEMPVYFYYGTVPEGGQYPDLHVLMGRVSLTGKAVRQGRMQVAYYKGTDFWTGNLVWKLALQMLPPPPPTPLDEKITEFNADITYSISNADELKRLATLVNAGKGTVNCTFLLTQDIDLQGSADNQWPSIGQKSGGSAYLPFSGLFDGQGHTISGLYIDRDDKIADKGLFAFVDESGVVRNLTVSGQAGGGNCVGGVVGHNRGRIENCVSKVQVSGEGFLGGVASVNLGEIRNCVNLGDVTGQGSCVGGIVGQIAESGLVEYCFNVAPVTGAREKIGGIAGYVGGSGPSLTHCVSLGTTLSGRAKVGRIAGDMEVTAVEHDTFARADMAVSGGGGVDGQTVTLSGDWQNTIFAGWDFETVWNEGSGDALPTLKVLGEQVMTVPNYPFPVYSGGDATPPPAPSVETGEGGTAQVDSKGTLTVLPGKGCYVDKVLVNGKPVTLRADGSLPGLKRGDKVEVIFKKISAGPALAPQDFADLEAEAWYYAPVEKVLSCGLMQGTGDGAFQPEKTMSRAQVWTVLFRMDGQSPGGGEGSLWYEGAASWAMKRGVSDGANPDKGVTREEFITMLWRLAGSPEAGGKDTALHTDVLPWAAGAVDWAVEENIMLGEIAPGRTVTRAEAAAMVMRYLEQKQVSL